MHKRIRGLFLLLALSLCLCACGQKAAEPGADGKEKTADMICSHEELKSVFTAATCTEAGKLDYICTRCGRSVRADLFPSTGHSFRYESNGTHHWQVCSVCGEKTDAAEHNFLNGVCVNCGFGCQHEWKDTVTGSNCALRGYTRHACVKCGYSYLDSYTNPKGHSFEAKATAPTCTEVGKTVYTCKSCGESYTETVAALGHKRILDSAKSPNCTESGLTEGSHCERCGAVLRAQQTIAPTGHKYKYECSESGHWQVCTVCGEKTAQSGHSLQNGVCTVCGYGCQHSYQDTVTAPSCTAQGYTTHVCSKCGVSYADSLTAPTGHAYGEAVTKEAGCTEEGTKTFTCAHCGSSYTEAIPPLGHKPVTDPAVAPGCTESGLTEGSHCERCGEVLQAPQTVAPTGHAYGEAVTKEAGCTEEGTKTFTCAHCGDSYTEPIPPLGHKSVTDPAVAPSCGESGLTEGKHCERCGSVLIPQSIVPATGEHEFVDGFCAHCGEPAPPTPPWGDREYELPKVEL